MNIAAIQSLVASVPLVSLQGAATALTEERAPEIDIAGNDEGERLTHVLAAIWILQHMHQTGNDVATSLRAYTRKVRSSIDSSGAM